MTTADKPITPLYFLASYPNSGEGLLAIAMYLLITLHERGEGGEIDLSRIEAEFPIDSHALLYRAVTGKDPQTLDEYAIAKARPLVHHFLATEGISRPIVRTTVSRGAFFGQPTINPEVTRGAAYMVRNPLSIAAELVTETGLQPMQILQLMMMTNRRVQTRADGVLEPHGSWTQNVASWTAAGQKEILVVRFEDAMSNPSKMLERLAAHIRMDLAKPLMQTAAGLLGKMAQQEEGAHWQAVLLPVHARAILEVHAVEMDRHGYLDNDTLAFAGIGREEALEFSKAHAPAMEEGA